MKLEPERAHATLETEVALRLGMSVVEAARGAIRIVDSQMADLVRQVTIGRGYDPRDFVVCAYGGAGPLHAPAFARELGVSRVVIPRGSLAAVMVCLWCCHSRSLRCDGALIDEEVAYAGR